MRGSLWLIAILTALGLSVSIGLVAHYGVTAVGDAVGVAGWSGVAAVILCHLFPLALCALAWRALLPTPPAGVARFIWFRVARDAGGSLLCMLPAGGEMLGIRTMRLAGVELGLAAASTVVDVMIELSAQVVFVLAGLTAVIVAGTSRALVGWALTGLAAMLPVLIAFALAQRSGLFQLLEHLAEKLARSRNWLVPGQTVGIHDHIRRLYAERSRVLRASGIHLVAWFIGIGEAGAALYLLGVPLDLGSLLALESLSYALRSATFFVPAAIGVQEGGYVALGALFGIGPDAALALSFLKRSRELTLGAVGIAAWQIAESGRAWQRVRARANTVAEKAGAS